MTAPRPNWFIGFPVAEHPELERLREALPKALSAFHPRDLHVTLAFLGSARPEQAWASWRTALELPCQPFRVQALQARPFGPQRRPSAYGLVVDDPAGSLGAFMASHQQPLRTLAGLAPETRPPLPHLTLGRPRPGLTRDAYRALADWCRQCPLPEAPLLLDQLALYTWAEDRRHRLFRVVARRVLQADA